MTMGQLFTDKRGLITGVFNKQSIAWAISEQILEMAPRWDSTKRGRDTSSGTSVITAKCTSATSEWPRPSPWSVGSTICGLGAAYCSRHR